MKQKHLQRHSLVAIATACALTLSAPTTHAQDTIAPGFALTADLPLPAAFAAYQTLANGDRVVFDGLSIDLYDDSNQLLLHLGDMPVFVFASFVEADPSESFVVIGESSNGDVFRVELDGSGISPLANLPFNFDCVFEDATQALISAATCGFGCGNDIARVDTTSGIVEFVANLPGPSGPIALHPDGRLFYGTQSDLFPPPAGSTDLVTWTATQLQSGNLLGLGDSTLHAAGLDGASSMAIDPVFGNLFVTESVFMATSKVLEFDGNGGLVGAVVTSLDFLGNVELFEGGAPGHFHAYQPADGVFMRYGNGTNVKTVRAQRPQGEIIQVGPMVEFRVTGAVPDAAFLLLWGSQATYDPIETAYGTFGDFLFLTGMPLGGIRRQPFMTPLDARGQGSFFFFDPGNLAGTLVFQGLCTTADGQDFVGASTAGLN